MSRAAASEFVLIAQARSGVTLGSSEVEVTHVPGNDRRFSVRIGTRMQRLAGSGPLIPTGLQATVIGPSASLEDMLENGIIAVNQIAPFLALLGNSTIHDFVPEVVWEATPSVIEREYLQLFVPAALPTLVKPRPVSADDVRAVSMAALKHPGADRIRRAIGQYFRALQNWQPGHETIAVTSLWIAAEILTPLVSMRAQKRWNCSSRHELAQSLGLEAKSLDSELRRFCIIGPEIYAEAKGASDGFEHGFLDFSEVMKKSAAIKEILAGRIRRVILDEVGLEHDRKRNLLSDPFDRAGCTVEHKFVRASLWDPEGKYASPPALRPYFRWEESWSALPTVADQPTTLQRQDAFTPELDPSVLVRNVRVEIRGGQEGYPHDATRSTEMGRPPTPESAPDLS